MRTLTSTLQDAQQKGSRKPYIQSIIADQPIEVPRWPWSSLYTGTEEDRFFDAVLDRGATGIVRARMTSLGAVYWQRITDPTQPTQWSTWSQMYPDATMSTVSQLSLSTISAHTRIFLVDYDKIRVWCRDTSDYVSWSTLEAVKPGVAGNEIWAIGSPDGDSDYCVMAISPTGADPNDYLVVYKRSAGVWSVDATDTTLWSNIDQIHVVKDGTTLLIVVCGTGPCHMTAYSYNTVAKTFGTAYRLLEAAAGSGFEYYNPTIVPSIKFAALPRFAHFWAEVYGGTPTHSRLNFSISPARTELAEIVPINNASQYGLRLLQLGGYWYLIGAKSAKRCPVYSGAASEKVDVSADLLAYTMVERGDAKPPRLGQPQRLVLELNNEDGRYANVGVSGTYQAVKEGSQIALKQGYVTSAGNEAVWATPFWVDRVYFWRDEKKGRRLIVEAIDALSYLDRLAVTHQITFTNRDLEFLLKYILNRVCGRLTNSTLTNLDLVIPSFTLQPGESYLTVLRRILDKAGIGLRFRTYESATSPPGFDSVEAVCVDLSSATSSYTYGGSSHPLVSYRFDSVGQKQNHYEVTGQNWAFGERFDWTHLELVLKDLTLKIEDLSLDTEAECLDRALYEQREAKREGQSGWLGVYANVGQEVLDVITITESAAGLASATRRVRLIETIYDTKRSLFQQRIELIGVGV
ncbi:MAG: hypothetical protein M1136_00960 [Chloroflexi bacterium]|nr:hypothetical protein [Chloroflexota bacterium]